MEGVVNFVDAIPSKIIGVYSLNMILNKAVMSIFH